eukprot:scaffold3761_cov42-Phaeocystis_antarctica.AAC.1
MRRVRMHSRTACNGRRATWRPSGGPVGSRQPHGRPPGESKLDPDPNPNLNPNPDPNPDPNPNPNPNLNW